MYEGMEKRKYMLCMSERVTEREGGGGGGYIVMGHDERVQCRDR